MWRNQYCHLRRFQLPGVHPPGHTVPAETNRSENDQRPQNESWQSAGSPARQYPEGPGPQPCTRGPPPLLNRIHPAYRSCPRCLWRWTPCAGTASVPSAGAAPYCRPASAPDVPEYPEPFSHRRPVPSENPNFRLPGRQIRWRPHKREAAVLHKRPTVTAIGFQSAPQKSWFSFSIS